MDIKEYTLPQFMMCLKAANELDALDRMAFVSDMAAVVGSLFSDSKPSPVEVHQDSLEDAAAGVINADKYKQT